MGLIEAEELLDNLYKLENESIYIMLEVVSVIRTSVMLHSIVIESAVMAQITKKHFGQQGHHSHYYTLKPLRKFRKSARYGTESMQKATCK